MNDVAILGAGLIGLLCANELAARGMSVVVVEKDDVGFEQSCRTVGAIRLPDVGNDRHAPSDLLQASGHEWERFAERWGCDIELNQGGWNVVAEDERDRDFLMRSAEVFGVSEDVSGRRELTAAEARRRHPSLLGPFRSMYVQPGGHLNQTLVLRALREAADRAGVDVRVNTVVTGFEHAGRGVTALRTTAGKIPCGAVLVAAGAWTDRMCDRLGQRIPMQRVRVEIGETGPAPRVVPGFLRVGTFGARQNGDGTIRMAGGFRVPDVVHNLSTDDLRDARLWLPMLLAHRREMHLGVDWRLLRHELARRAFRRDRDVVMTGYEPAFAKRRVLARLQRLKRLIPALEAVRIHRWHGGIVDMTPDHEPVLGRLDVHPNAYVASGFSGHGFMVGPAAAALVSRLIAEGGPVPGLEPYRPNRFATP